MALTYGLLSARSLYEKLQRDAEALKEEVNSDRFFNFVVTGYSLIDWVKEDPSVPQTVQTAAKNIYKDINHDQWKWIKRCGDIATASKHFTVTRRQLITSSATSEQGFGVARYGLGGFGEGEERIEVTLTDGLSFDCLQLVDGVMNTWEDFFSSHGI
ncbi:hypothetical protein [Microcoleus sp.]|uniref:hypothetical protein n=1 Tax=Microcoleus sp. TaxID=44472 RepID=UPI00403E839E